MTKQQQTRERVFDLKLRKFEQINLSSTPVLITSEFIDPLVEEVHLLFRVDCYGCIAEDSTEANTNLADSSKRRKFLAGETQSYFGGNLWFKSASGDTVAEAIDKEVYEQ